MSTPMIINFRPPPDKFCFDCGARMTIKKKRFFDAQTGTVMYSPIYRCPNFRWLTFWRHSWWESWQSYVEDLPIERTAAPALPQKRPAS